jgi:tetratricopeptide (TPR) repeat protein
MSRFNNLEFGEEFNNEPQSQTAQRPGSKPNLKDEAHHLLAAKSAFENGRFEMALRSYAKVLEFNPHNPAAWIGQVRMLIELEQYEQAKLWADKALEHFANEPELLAAKAVALARLGDLKAALVYSDASIEEHGDTPYIWLARGDVQLAREEQRADFCFEKAFSLAPHDWFTRWLGARIHYYYEKFATALRLVQEALSFNAAHGVLWLQLGLCQQALGLVAPAKISFQQARELSPQSQEADNALRELYRLVFWSKLRNQWRNHPRRPRCFDCRRGDQHGP